MDCAAQRALFDYGESHGILRRYLPRLTAVENGKGVLDVDTVKGCTLGMNRYSDGGCYGECYAYKTANLYGIDFATSISRRLMPFDWVSIFCAVRDHPASWYRIGTAGDPCHDWENTLDVCEQLQGAGKTPVIITKHWKDLSDADLTRLNRLGAVVNTSTSALDSDAETKYRVRQIGRLREVGIRSVNRVVTCDFGPTEWGGERKEKQDYLLSIGPIIDNPLRASKQNPRVVSGDIMLKRIDDAIGGGKFISLHNNSVYLGKCEGCPDQCGVTQYRKSIVMNSTVHQDQTALFQDKVEWVYLPTVIGSGYEADVSRLAIEDVIAKRAARKNMQIHSAIVLKINDEFCGFFTFQNNEVSKEFCLLQSVIEPAKYTKELYAQMVREVVA